MKYAADKDKVVDEGESFYAVTGINCKAETAVEEMVCGGMSGSVAVKKFWRLVASFRFPKVSLANKVRVVL